MLGESDSPSKLTATAIRLVEFGSFPAVLVCNSKQGRVWSIRGVDIPNIKVTDSPGGHKQNLLHEKINSAAQMRLKQAIG